VEVVGVKVVGVGVVGAKSACVTVGVKGAVEMKFADVGPDREDIQVEELGQGEAEI
jgi:hypothetical protein